MKPILADDDEGILVLASDTSVAIGEIGAGRRLFDERTIYMRHEVAMALAQTILAVTDVPKEQTLIFSGPAAMEPSHDKNDERITASVGVGIFGPEVWIREVYDGSTETAVYISDMSVARRLAGAIVETVEGGPS